jgi:CDP-6-deoxy-D-xylo-4-hexulose-3-dehydrase
MPSARLHAGRSVGSFGHVGTLSFYPAHHITTGEGGAVFTDDPTAGPRIIESFRDWGRDCYCAPGKDNTCGKRFDWQLGDPALRLRPQVHLFPRRLQPQDHRHAGGTRRGADGAPGRVHRSPARQFRTPAGGCGLRGVPDPARGHADSVPSWFGFLVTLRENAPCTRVDLLRYLDQHKVGTRLLFAGNVTRQPYMKGRHYRVSGALAIANVITERSFWIGVYPGLSDEMLDSFSRWPTTTWAKSPMGRR